MAGSMRSHEALNLLGPRSGLRRGAMHPSRPGWAGAAPLQRFGATYNRLRDGIPGAKYTPPLVLLLLLTGALPGVLAGREVLQFHMPAARRRELGVGGCVRLGRESARPRQVARSRGAPGRYPPRHHASPPSGPCALRARVAVGATRDKRPYVMYCKEPTTASTLPNHTLPQKHSRARRNPATAPSSALLLAFGTPIASRAN